MNTLNIKEAQTSLFTGMQLNSKQQFQTQFNKSQGLKPSYQTIGLPNQTFKQDFKSDRGLVMLNAQNGQQKNYSKPAPVVDKKFRIQDKANQISISNFKVGQQAQNQVQIPSFMSWF